MGLEIVAGRMLTPYYGDTVYLWGSIIGIFLLSLSLGYFFGGKLADKKPDVNTLSVILFVTGLFVFLIPFFAQHVVAWFDNLSRIIAPLFAVTVIFIVPSMLLGVVSPYAIKLKAKKLQNIGKVSGNLYATATLGSVVGTFFTTFVLILLLPVTTIYFILGGLLLLTSILLSTKGVTGFLFSKKGIIVLVLFGLFLVAFASEKTAPTDLKHSPIYDRIPNTTIIYEEQSLYGDVVVFDRTTFPFRSMAIGGGFMGAINVDDNFKLVPGWEYTECMQIPFMINDDLNDVAVLGTGTGYFSRILNQRHSARVDTVDINDVVIDAAKKYFNLTSSDTLHIFNDDARIFLKESEKKYDFISVDVYHHDPTEGYKLPMHIVTKEFFELVQDHLTEDGVFAMNFATIPENSFFNSAYRTIASVFDHAVTIDCATQVVIASNSDLYNAREISAIIAADFTAGAVYDLLPRNDSIVFTDDYAPVNSFLS